MNESPRWRLISAHYLNVLSLGDGTTVEWEHKETARETGRTVRKLFKVPALLNPADPSDCNYPGELIVAHEPIEGQNNTHRHEIFFIGDPTQEMEPLNEAAQAITDSMRQKWEHPIDTLPANGGMTAHEQAFMENMMKVFAGTVQASNQTVPKAEYDELKARLDRFEAMLAAQNKPTVTEVARRV